MGGMRGDIEHEGDLCPGCIAYELQTVIADDCGVVALMSGWLLPFRQTAVRCADGKDAILIARVGAHGHVVANARWHDAMRVPVLRAVARHPSLVHVLAKKPNAVASISQLWEDGQAAIRV